MWYWATWGSHGVAACSRPDLANRGVVPHVWRVEQHGGVTCEVWGLGDGRGGYERPVLEDAAVRH